MLRLSPSRLMSSVRFNRLTRGMVLKGFVELCSMDSKNNADMLRSFSLPLPHSEKLKK